jgi:hypothetical protein
MMPGDDHDVAGADDWHQKKKEERKTWRQEQKNRSQIKIRAAKKAQEEADRHVLGKQEQPYTRKEKLSLLKRKWELGDEATRTAYHQKK